MCDHVLLLQGHLTQLAIAQAGLICPAGLPASFSQLEFLETIDLAFNDINMDIVDMGKVSSQPAGGTSNKAAGLLSNFSHIACIL